MSTRWETANAGRVAGLPRKGSITGDAGAAKALRDQGRSLLPAGVSGVKGRFQRGDAVAITDGDGQRIACGIANYSAEEILRIRGVRSDRIETVLGHHYGGEGVHRDNLVVL